MKFVRHLTKCFMLYVRHLGGAILALGQHFIICTCPSITPWFWQAVSVKTAMSGMSAPSVLSMAAGDKETEKEKGVRGQWVRNRTRKVVDRELLQNVLVHLFVFLNTGSELDQFFTSHLIIIAFGCFLPLSTLLKACNFVLKPQNTSADCPNDYRVDSHFSNLSHNFNCFFKEKKNSTSWKVLG